MSQVGEITPNQIPVSAIHQNTELTLIQITEDKLRLVLMEHLGAVEATRRWQVPLGIVLALIPMFLTSDFKDFGSVDKATWRAFFMFATVASLVWFVWSLRFAFKSVALNDLIQKVKNVASEKA